MLAAGLPRVGGVIRVLILLNPDLRFGKEIRAVGVIPVRVAENDVRDLVRFDAEAGDSFVRPNKIVHLPCFEELGSVKAGIEENVVTAAANEPDHHGDVEFAIAFVVADKSGDGKIGEGRVADCVDLVLCSGDL